MKFNTKARPQSARLLIFLYAAMVILFAAGIVGVPANFGDSGEPFSHAQTGIIVFKAAALIGLGVGTLVLGLNQLAAGFAIQNSRNESRAINDCILDSIDQAVLLADIRQADLALVYVNAAFEKITGYSATEAIGKNCRYLQGDDRMQSEVSEMRDAIENRRATRVTLRNYRKDGSLFWNELQLLPVFADGRDVTHFVGIIRDVSDLKTMASRLEVAGHIDRLTSVANRSFFYDKLAKLLDASTTTSVLVAKIDVARFHEINAGYGYEGGDAILIQIAERLSKLFVDVVGRLGADEFALAVGVTGLNAANSVMAGLIAALQPRFALPGATIPVRFAIGFTLGARGADPRALMREAGVALQESRRSRLREVRGFDSLTEENIKRRVQLTHELHQAVANEDFTLHYQPKVELDTGRIIGAEALLRWRHPVLGLQPPSLFIPIAEETGLISDMGAWVLREATKLAVRVNQARSAPLTISVNVSQLQFQDRDMHQFVAKVLNETGAEPSWLILELTESLFADGSPDLIATFQRLRDTGLGLSIDDFGTGYSSLRYIERFPISEIKLDRGFVQDLPQSRTKQVIVDAVIKIGVGLNISITAEGVETEAERAILRDFGCRYAQGYLFGRPTEAAQFLRLVEEPGRARQEP